MSYISFVTGGTGFIGSYLVKRLIKEGHKVRVLARDPKKAKSLFGNEVDIIHGNINDKAALATGTKGADFVFHLAARVGDYGPKVDFFRTNVDGTRAVVEASERASVSRFIYASSNAVIGTKREKVTTESTPYSKTGGPYGITKGFAEKIILERYKEKNFPAVILRPSVVYGPGDQNFIIRPFELIKKGKLPLINSGRGSCWHTYVENLVDAMILSLANGLAGEIFIITDGGNTTWEEYFNKLAEVAGYPKIERNIPKSVAMPLAWIMYGLYKIARIKPILTPLNVGIVTSEAGVSIEKARKILKYTPKVDLDEGMRRVGAWLREEKLI
jgi:nucleoside-diphosphate-sugar epimerase